MIQPIAWIPIDGGPQYQPNGPPTGDDGESTHPHREIHVMTVFVQDDAADTWSGVWWVRYTGHWARINQLDWLCSVGLFKHSLAGVLPLWYPERVYFELESIGPADSSVLPHVGVTVPGWVSGDV